MSAPAPTVSRIQFTHSPVVSWAPAELPSHVAEGAGPQPSAPSLHQMPPLLRRHAGQLGRIACSVAYDALGPARDLPVVFASRYGEVSRSVDLLSSLAANDELSPASFGLSVHNAITGLFSMARKETSNSLALAAGDDSAEYGMIEACGLLAQGEREVLLIVADVPLPSVYASFADTAPIPFGWACVVSDTGGRKCTLSWTDESVSDAIARAATAGSGVIDEVTPNPLPGALQVLPFLQGNASECVRHSDGRRWHWMQRG